MKGKEYFLILVMFFKKFMIFILYQEKKYKRENTRIINKYKKENCWI
jgi:hypothetical protein